MPTDQEIEDIRQSAQNLTELLELAKLPSSQAVFDPSKLVYYKTESIKLHEMFNAYRVENGKSDNVTVWQDAVAGCAQAQATYNLLIKALTSVPSQYPTWSTAAHDGGQIGTNDINPQNISSYAEDAFQAFINSPPHRSNVLNAYGKYEGVAIVGYTFHGFNNVVCICEWSTVDLDTTGFDGFAYEWEENVYARCGNVPFNAIPGCTEENVANALKNNIS